MAAWSLASSTPQMSYRRNVRIEAGKQAAKTLQIYAGAAAGHRQIHHRGLVIRKADRKPRKIAFKNASGTHTNTHERVFLTGWKGATGRRFLSKDWGPPCKRYMKNASVQSKHPGQTGGVSKIKRPKFGIAQICFARKTVHVLVERGERGVLAYGHAPS